jgi:hypothetical protein
MTEAERERERKKRDGRESSLTETRLGWFMQDTHSFRDHRLFR